ncbi:MAG TPA: DUF2920 family protein [Coleofasciculaceae cyanobacterium]|jgi:hypothetical protein
MSTITEIQEIQGSIEGLSDFELGNRPRTRPITYSLNLPADCSADNPAKGLVFYIPGFGEDNKAEYINKICRFMAETHGLASVSVDYHAIQARPEQGASIALDAESDQKLRLLCHYHGLPFSRTDIMDTLTQLGEKATEITTLRAIISPPNDEYQNFGILQALDYLTVINDLIAEGVPFDWNNIILVGSSHGGYIAHLICKLAPNTINAVIDNSSYTRTAMTYLGLFPEIYFPSGKIQIEANVKTHWQLKDRCIPHHFGLSQQLIRDVAFVPHIEEMKRKSERLPQYFCFNSTDDHISPIHEKRSQQRRLQAIGCECELKEINPEDIDGKIFKTMNHGMDASMKSLCEQFLPRIKPRATTLDRVRGTVLEYDCFDQVYRFEHMQDAPWLRASIISSESAT